MSEKDDFKIVTENNGKECVTMDKIRLLVSNICQNFYSREPVETGCHSFLSNLLVFFPGAATHSGSVFYSHLSGFSLLAYEVT
jgi:hypothetical protein